MIENETEPAESKSEMSRRTIQCIESIDSVVPLRSVGEQRGFGT